MAGPCLTSAQASAVEYVAAREWTDLHADRARDQLRRWLCGERDGGALGLELLTMNFHPDRPAGRDGDVIASVLRSGRLMNQFESGSTNGFDGSKADVRARRESLLFGGRYDGADPAERPKYGAVNLFDNPRGGWPRYGSCHWVLDPAVAPNCTVTVPGSHSSTAWLGSHAHLPGLVADAAADRPCNHGRHRFRLIDGPVELQVHGDVLLERDVTALVLDPSFRGTAVEATADAISATFNVALGWGRPLHNTGADWDIPAVRRHAGRRVGRAVSSGELITAAWIGRDRPPDPPGSTSWAVVSGACRYLWNRLLLTQNSPPSTRCRQAPGRSSPPAGESTSSSGTGRFR